MDKQQIIDKVIKLLALSEGTDHTPEAEAAKNMAAELMAKYDISVAESHKDSKFTTCEQKLNRKSPIRYDSTLINIISKFNGVAYIARESHGKGANVFVGTKTDVECNFYMIDILIQQRTMAWKKFLEEQKAGIGAYPSCTGKKRYMMGFAFGVREKLEELVEMKEAKIEEKGLVVVDFALEALKQYQEENGATTSSQSSQRYNEKGFKAGKAAHIHKGIDGTSSTIKRIS